MAEALPVPLAVETGVNYLAPRADDLADGAFTAAVLEAAGCGLLLDLHNVWTNERNGRQAVEEFLAEVPLDRVWEVHLAGGFEHRGYWLDSHSGSVPDPLLELAERVVPRLPNLRALIFELFPGYLSQVGLDLVRVQLERLHAVWAARAAPRPAVSRRQPRSAPAAEGPSPAAWENALGALVVGRPPDGPLARELAADPGIEVIRELLGEFRASMVTDTLKLTARLLMLALGGARFRALLEEHWRAAPPSLFAADEAARFAALLERRLPRLAEEVPWLAGVLAFERAVTATLLDGVARVVAFPWDPVPVLRALAEGRLPAPELVRAGSYEVELTPDDAAEAAGADLLPLEAPQILHR
jgi:hypothetical protein